MNKTDLYTFVTGGHAEFSITNNWVPATLIYRVCPQGGVYTHKGHDRSVYIGKIQNGKFHRYYQNAHLENTGVFRWFWEILVSHDKEIPAHVVVAHRGKCGRCGRKLIDPVSVERGLGPVCAKKITLSAY